MEVILHLPKWGKIEDVYLGKRELGRSQSRITRPQVSWIQFMKCVLSPRTHCRFIMLKLALVKLGMVSHLYGRPGSFLSSVLGIFDILNRPSSDVLS